MNCDRVSHFFLWFSDQLKAKILLICNCRMEENSGSLCLKCSQVVYRKAINVKSLALKKQIKNIFRHSVFY